MDDHHDAAAADSPTVGGDGLKECRQQLAELEAKWKRAVADYQNREKDIAREREEFARFCTVGLVRDFLPIVDAIEAGSRKPEAGIDAATEQQDATSGYRLSAIGYTQLHRLCLDSLKRHGVESIGAVGDRVDYLLHEVVGKKTVSGTVSEKVSDTVLEVVQVGYTMHGRLLRPAKVIVCTERDELPPGHDHPEDPQSPKDLAEKEEEENGK